MESANSDAADKFKRRLIRTIARSLLQEKLPEKEVWEKLSKETGCDCELLWKRIRSLTLKKLKRLLPADDRNDKIPSIARMTVNDWLYFDLFLVHEKIDFIGQEKLKTSRSEYRPLIELFSLVQKFDIEARRDRDLAEAWAAATYYYNSQGRQCSPMMLQRRWYQLKELTRVVFYEFWHSNRGNTKQMEKSQLQPTVLQTAIAKRFPHVVVQPFFEWSALIEQKLVVSPDVFEHKLKTMSKPVEESPDVIMVQPVIETITLEEESDVEDSNDAFDTELNINTTERDTTMPVEIKNEPSDIDIEETMINSIIPTEEAHRLQTERLTAAEKETYDKIVELELNNDTLHVPQVLPQITSVFGNVDIGDDKFGDAEMVAMEPTTIEPTVVATVAPTIAATIAATIAPTIAPITSPTEIVTESIQDNVLNITNPFIIMPNVTKTPDLSTDLNDIIKEKAEKFINGSKTDKPALDILNPFGEIPTDLNLGDDGIEFMDDGIEFKDYDDEKEVESIVIKTEIQEEKVNNEEICDEAKEPKIDPKLLLCPVVYTTKLDDMRIFNSNNYSINNDKSLIEKVISVSKPISARDIRNIKEEKKEEKEEKEESEIPENKRVKLSSCLLQKPRNRTYNPIQLCKNPDFNTRLKRLTAGFFCYQRNRELLKVCKPLTIDLNKAFERKLIGNTVYLKDCIKLEKEAIVSKNAQDSNQTTSVLPSAMAVQSLIDNTVVNINNLPKSNTSNNIETPKEVNSEISCVTYGTPKPIEDDPAVSERSKVINLPNISDVRRINQRLLTAEVSPIRVGNDSTGKPPVHLLPVTPKLEHNKLNADSNNTGKSNNEDIARVIENQNTEKVIPPGKSAETAIGQNKNPAVPLIDSAPSQNNSLTGEPNTSSLLQKTNDNIDKHAKDAPAQKTKPKNKQRYREPVPWLQPKIPPKKPYNNIYLSKPVPAPWSTNNVPNANDAAFHNEAILTVDALNKMLGLFGTDSVTKKTPGDPKKKKNKPGPPTTSSRGIQLTEDVAPTTETTKNCEKKLKTRVFPGESKLAPECCWAREKLKRLRSKVKNKISTHKCVPPICKCCCRDELVKLVTAKQAQDNIRAKKQAAKNEQPIVLSDEEDNVTKAIDSVARGIDSSKTSLNKSEIKEVSTTIVPNANKDSTMSTVSPVSNEASKTSANDTGIKQVSANIISNESKDSTISSALPASNEPSNTTVNDTEIQEVSATIVPNEIKDTPVSSALPVSNNIEVTSSLPADSDGNTVPEKPKISITICNLANNVVQGTADCQKKPIDSSETLPKPADSFIINSALIKDKDLTYNQVVGKFKSKVPVDGCTCQIPSLTLGTSNRRIIVDGSHICPMHPIQTLKTKRPATKSTTDKILYLSSKHISSTPSESPIRLGKNKILLSTVRYPGKTESYTSYNTDASNTFMSPRVVPTLALPRGVQITLLPNNELTYTIESGVTLTQEELDTLPIIMKAVQEQMDACITGISQENLTAVPNSNLQQNVEATLPINQNEPNKSAVNDQVPIDVDADPTEATIPVIDVTETESVASNGNSKSQPNQEQTTSNYTDSVHVIDGEHPPESIPSSLKSAQCSDNVENSSNITDAETKTNDDITEAPMQQNDIPESDKSENVTEGVCEVSKDINQTTTTNRKSLLSDLMEMSGISAEDTTPALDTVVAEPPSVSRVVINPDNDTNLPVLYPISSFVELKYACEHNGKFFKLDCVTNIVVPINVCIKKNAQKNKSQNKQGVAAQSVIDLTDDGDADDAVTPVSLIKSYVTPSKTQKYGTIHVTNKNSSKKYKIKPYPSILNRSRSLLKPDNKIEQHPKALRKQVLQTKDAEYEEEEWLMSDSELDDLEPSSTNIEVSDDSSDDEPLAKKVKRKEIANIDEAKKDAQISEEIPKQKPEEPVNLPLTKDKEISGQPLNDPEPMDSESDGDCILGV